MADDDGSGPGLGLGLGLGAVTAVAALTVWTMASMCLGMAFFATATGGCSGYDTNFTCTGHGGDFAWWAPVIGAGTGLALAFVGLLPHRSRRSWITAGYVLAAVGAIIGLGIASTGP
jgi:hypothetical protein